MKSLCASEYTRYPSFDPLSRPYTPGKGPSTRKETATPKNKPDAEDEG